MASLEQFAQNMRTLADRVERRAPEMQRKLAADILRLVIYGTPVGNKEIWHEPGKARVGYVGGRARANWFVAIGAPSTHTTEEVDRSGTSTIAAGRAAIGAAPAHSEIHLSNNLPYIIPLNNGHSRQAPEGFIERAVEAALVTLRSARVLEEGSGGTP